MGWTFQRRERGTTDREFFHDGDRRYKVTGWRTMDWELVPA
jgi:hypothetical protein